MIPVKPFSIKIRFRFFFHPYWSKGDINAMLKEKNGSTFVFRNENDFSTEKETNEFFYKYANATEISNENILYFENFCKITSCMVKEGELNFDDYVFLTSQCASLIKKKIFS